MSARTNRSVSSLLVAAAGLGVGMCFATPSQASAIPANAGYGDTFPSPGTRGTNLSGDAPEVDTVGTANRAGSTGVYTTGGAGGYEVTTTNTSNSINDGSTGVLGVVKPDSAFLPTLRLPVPNGPDYSNGFVSQVDIVPGGQGGFLAFSYQSNGNVYREANNLRFGINTHGTATGSDDTLKARRGDPRGVNTDFSLSNVSGYDPDNWNNLKVVKDAAAGNLDIFVNGTKVTSYSLGTFFGGLSNTYFGLEQQDFSSDTYYDNLSIAPIPEPASLALLGLGGLALLGRRRRQHDHRA